MFNGDTAYISQLKQQKSKSFYYVGACKSNSTFLIFAVLVVWCRPCRR